MNESLAPEIVARIKSLEEKYKNSGQDLGAFLDGLLHDRFLTYWDYLHLDTLLSLQIPYTHFPDETIFITYHQITELYFKLVLHEINQITTHPNLSVKFFTERIKRINRYFEILENSFDVMAKGMEKEQFLQFRLSLIPASGFQSVQYRMIEVYTTGLENLVHEDRRHMINDWSSIEDKYQYLYWKYGATEKETGEKTLTLKQFEKRYTPRLLRIANQVEHNTIYDCYRRLSISDQNNIELIETLRNFDRNVNVNWCLAHLKAALYHLSKNKEQAIGTGGTNWRKFLPPSFQRISFFPTLWTDEERAEWGKSWITALFNNDK